MIATAVVLSNLLYLVGAVVLAVIGGVIVAVRHRKPKSVEANMESFNRGLRALSPVPPAARTGRAQTRPARPDARSVRPIPRAGESEASTG